MGTVYLAESPASVRVAIKVIRPELAGDAAFIERFRREVGAARRVAGFCTAQVLDASLDGPAPYLVTEYVDGVRLDLVVERDGPLAASNLEGLAVGVAAACAAIHAAEVVHRDLKPGNVLLSYFGPRVIDFGIARALDDASAAITRAGSVMGTPAWMAPEQFGNAPVTTAADIFAWGGLVAYAGTGRLAFGRGPVEVLTYRIVHQPPDLGGLAEPLRQLVERAMAKDPALRPSARGLLAELLGDDAGAEPRNMGHEVTKVLRRTWVQEPTQPPPPLPPPGWAGQQGSGGQSTPAGPTPAQPTGWASGPERGGPPGSEPARPSGPQPARPVGWAPASGSERARPAGPQPARPTGWSSGPEPARPSGWSPGPQPAPAGWGVPTPDGRRVPGNARLRGVLVALAILVFGALATLSNGDHRGGGGDSDNSGQGGSSNYQRGASGSPATSPAGGSGSQSGVSRSQAPYAPVRDGKFEFRVTRFGCGPSVFGSGPAAIRAQGKFCLLTMKVRNIGREPQNIDANAQYLYAVGGSRNQVDGGATLRAGSKLLFARVNPGNSVSGTLIYDVPTSFRPLSVELHDSPISRGTRLSLSWPESAPPAGNGAAGDGPEGSRRQPATAPPATARKGRAAGGGRAAQLEGRFQKSAVRPRRGAGSGATPCAPAKASRASMARSQSVPSASAPAAGAPSTRASSASSSSSGRSSSSGAPTERRSSSSSPSCRRSPGSRRARSPLPASAKRARSSRARRR
jgi:hypothetical protein